MALTSVHKQKLIKLGNRIRDIRAEKRMTQLQLCKSASIEKANISRIESGQANPTIATLFKIADALTVPTAKLFEGL